MLERVLDDILRVQFILSCLSPNIEVHLDDDIRVTTKKKTTKFPTSIMSLFRSLSNL